MKRFFSIIAASAVAMTASAALATNIGTATGDLVIHYGAGSETPANQTYISVTNAPFNYNTALTDNGTDGYGPHHYFQNGTNVFAVDLSFGVNGNTAPDVTAYTVHDSTTSNVDWAITVGPGYNSHLRGGNGDGSSIHLTNEYLTQTGTAFHLDIYGFLTTDGQVHWATAAPTAIGTNPGLGGGNVYFYGSFDYNSAGDSGSDGHDTYTGVMTFDTAPIAVPLPASAWSGLALLGVLGAASGMKRLRRQEA